MSGEFWVSRVQRHYHPTIALPCGTASVAKTAEGSSMARMMATLNRTHNLEMRVFDSEDAARRWLGRLDKDDDCAVSGWGIGGGRRQSEEC